MALRIVDLLCCSTIVARGVPWPYIILVLPMIGVKFWLKYVLFSIWLGGDVARAMLDKEEYCQELGSWLLSSLDKPEKYSASKSES